MITYETEYFWRHPGAEWKIGNIPDPKCEDPEQYAVMAALVEVLVESFIWRLELGMRRTDRPMVSRSEDPPPFTPEVCPPWAAGVPGLKEKLVLDPEEDKYFDSSLHRRNIYMATGWFFTV